MASNVINYSVSGTQTNFLNAVEMAFLNAYEAGVFVAASSGNSGPTASTTAHPSPWITTVAANTHPRTGTATVTLGNGTQVTGASLTPAVPMDDLVYSTNVGLPGADPTDLAQCWSADSNGGTVSLDPAKVAGKIVFCDRGGNALVDKSLAVKDAGGIGMILGNVMGGSTTVNALLHSVPTVHLALAQADIVRAYIAANLATATAAFSNPTITYNAPGNPAIASFSSRGPSLATGDQLKPDISAPGVDILASVAPPGNAGESFSLYQGTSMSAPHIAGVAALLKQRRPDWTPDMAKSAMMTTGTDLVGSPGPFAQGGGQVNPNKAADPGLVYKSGGVNAYLGFLCGLGTISGGDCPALTMDPSDLNLPSIAIGDLAGTQTVKRSVTNVQFTSVGGDRNATATYQASVTGLTGLNVSVNPSTLTLKPGETKQFTVTFTYASGAFDAYRTGNLVWTQTKGGGRVVRSPVVIRPVRISAPELIIGQGTTNSKVVTIKPGSSGTFSTAIRGLAEGYEGTVTIPEDSDATFDPADAEGTLAVPITMPAGLKRARFATFDEETSGQDDLDMYLYQGTTEVAVSAGGTSEEQIDLVNPAPGNYTLYVHAFDTEAASTTFTLYGWFLQPLDAGNMTVTGPANVTVGQSTNLTFSWSNLNAGKRYLGEVDYIIGGTLAGTSIVRIDT